MTSRVTGRLVAAALASVCVTAPAMGEQWEKGHHHRVPLGLGVLGTYSTGLGAGAAEIVAYDKHSRRLLVINAAASSVDILSVRDPHSPSLVKRLELAELGSPNSVDVRDGVMAVAIQAAVKTDPGVVAFYTTDGAALGTVKVGSLPDMLTFTRDGRHVLVANEAEPSGYGAGHVDPEGSVSIVRVPHSKHEWQKFGAGNVRTADFRRFNGQEAGLRVQGIRIYGPGASAAQDF